MRIYCAKYLQTVIPNKSLEKNVKLCRTTGHCRLFDVLSLIFDSVGVAVFIVYHFGLFYRPGTRNNLLFINQSQIQIWPKVVSVHPVDLDGGKLLDFHNIRIRTLSLHQSGLARSITFSTGPSVRTSQILSTPYFTNEWTSFAANWHKWAMGGGHETFNFVFQDVKGQGHKRPKLDLEAWWRHLYRRPWVE